MKSPGEVFVKPNPAIPGARVRDPLTLVPLKAEGELKPRTNFWIRRIKFKDVVEGDVQPSGSSAPEFPADVVEPETKPLDEMPAWDKKGSTKKGKGK